MFSAILCTGSAFALGAPANIHLNIATDTPPTVSLNLESTSTVSGAVPLTASASDDVGIAGVRFYIDGSEQGAPVMQPPYTFNWFSTTTENGEHHVAAVAYDMVGNETVTDDIVVNVENAPATTTVEETPPSIVLQASGGPPPTVKAGPLTVPITIKNIRCFSCETGSPNVTIEAYVTPWYENDGPNSTESKTRYGDQTLTVSSIANTRSSETTWSGSLKPGHYYFVVIVDPTDQFGTFRTHRSEFKVVK